MEEAGFSPGAMTQAFTDEFILGALAKLVRELGHYPVANELRRKAREAPGFPSRNTFDRFGGKAAARSRLAEYCRGRSELSDVLEMLGDVGDAVVWRVQAPRSVVGYVYLAKSGPHFKIGQTNDLVRRTNELRIQLPKRLDLVHQISTDDPVGIERYWHQRFAHLRKIGEWFALGAAEVAIFNRRKFM